MDARGHNARVWERPGSDLAAWSEPVSPARVAAARNGSWQVKLTPTKVVPATWFPSLTDLDVLGLAAGGGQQGPIFAAAGARVTTFDIAERQLRLDREVAARDGLQIQTTRGDMSDLSAFAGGTFDLIFHPSANSYVDDLSPVWRECFRVLRPGGCLLAGFNNPAVYIFDHNDHTNGVLTVRHPLPFSDAQDLPEDERQAFVDAGVALEYSHTLETQIGGQLDAGFELLGLYEDRMDELALASFMATSIATRARKPAAPTH